MKKLTHIAISVVFLIFIMATFFVHETGMISSKPSTENRKLAEKPTIDLNHLDKFPGLFEPYYNDHFSFRRPYIELNNKLGMKLFRKANMGGKVIVGKDNWLFEMKKDLPIYLSKKTFTQHQLEKIEEELTNRIEYFDELGIKTYFLICPSKYSIYPEKLPMFLQHGNMKQTDQFIGLLDEIEGAVYVDGRESLRRVKDEHTVYLKYDTHWNRLGTYFAVTDLIKKIKIDFPSVPDYSLNDWIIDTSDVTSGNLMWMIGKDKGYSEPEYTLNILNQKVTKLSGYQHPKTDDFPYKQYDYCRRRSSTVPVTDSLDVLLFHDSYAVAARPFLPYYFSNTLFIWDSWKYKFNKEIVDYEKPDILIYWMYEGFIDRILLEPSFVEPDSIDSGLQ
jgi:alginate O-acetyltransferase complex protein AlgJ